jgi:mycothiol synthase
MDVTTHRSIDAPSRRAVINLLERATAADGLHPLSDHSWLEFTDADSPGFAAMLGTETGHDHLIGYGQVSHVPGDKSWMLDTVLDPHHRFDGSGNIRALIDSALSLIDSQGGGPVQYWISHPTESHDKLLAEYGFTRGRDLLQMRIDLPLSVHTDLPTRPFEIGKDEAAWLAVNNAAFAWHPEQGGWTVEELVRREGEPWFDPDGFLLHEIDGQLAGFCWTKVHRGPVPMGEIYVVAVDPAFGGRGLGRALTIAGLDSLYRRSMHTGMLFVDADNTTAVNLYDRLGFRRNHINRAYRTVR